MKKEMYLRAILSLSAASIVAAACFKSVLPEESTFLRVSIPDSSQLPTRTDAGTDTDNYILSVSSPEGEIIYSGLYKDSPETFQISPGTYTVSAISCLFTEPAYDTPVYGDTKVVVAGAGETVSVSLDCQMQNCGLALSADYGFRQRFPDAILYLRSDEGSLQYTYSENRIGYFNPGKITVTMVNGDSSEDLFSRVLEKRQVLSVGLSAPTDDGTGEAGIFIQVDTTKDYLSDQYTYGESGNDIRNAMSIYDARNASGATGVWVYGYVAGCATSTSKVEFNEPFTKNTNIVIGERSTTEERDYCMSVELKTGAIRDALNLVDHPENKGKKILVKGDVVSSYFGLPGIKNITEYSF